MDTRRHELDWLRVLAVLLLIYFHSARIFDFGDFYVKNGELNKGMQAFVTFVDIWFMPIFFFIAGAASFYALGKRSGKQYAGERSKKTAGALRLWEHSDRRAPGIHRTAAAARLQPELSAVLRLHLLHYLPHRGHRGERRSRQDSRLHPGARAPLVHPLPLCILPGLPAPLPAPAGREGQGVQRPRCIAVEQAGGASYSSPYRSSSTTVCP
jgi:hypothetical protein